MTRPTSAYLVKCELCPREVDIRAAGTHQFVTGWAMNRAGGGAHAIALRKPERRWAHRECIEAEARGLRFQSSLFGESPS